MYFKKFLFILITLSSLSSYAQLQPFSQTDWHNSRMMAKVTELFRQSKILALSDNAHGYSLLYLFLNTLLQNVGTDVDYLGLEISSDKQTQLDQLVSGELDHFDDFKHWTDTEEGKAAFHLVIQTIRRLNILRLHEGKPPMQVLALDKPDCCGGSKEWFLQRDQHMYEVLKSRSNNFSLRGILFLGGAHLSKGQFPLPKMAHRHMGAKRWKTLGYLLDHDEAVSQNIVRIWTEVELLAVDLWSFVSLDFLAMKTIGRRLLKEGLIFIPTDSRAFQRAERLARSLPFTAPYKVGDNFDYFLRFEGTFPLGDQCEAILSHPQKLLRGLLIQSFSLL